MEDLIETASGAERNGARLSKTMRRGRKVYFFDVRESKKGNSYLQITESRQSPSGQHYRSSIFLFPDNIQEFQQILGEVAAHI